MKPINLNGNYDTKGCFFEHTNIDNRRVLTGKYPDQVSLMYHNSFCSIKSDDHQMTLQYFKSGGTIHAFDLRQRDSVGTLFLDKFGNFRVSVRPSKPDTENISIFIAGITTELVSIGGTRSVKQIT